MGVTVSKIDALCIGRQKQQRRQDFQIYLRALETFMGIHLMKISSLEFVGFFARIRKIRKRETHVRAILNSLRKAVACPRLLFLPC